MASAIDQEKEFEFTRDDFDYLRKIVTATTGIIADDDKYTMYYSRLARRVRKLGLMNFREYRAHLESNREEEIIELVNSVTTNLTAFFREKHHFNFLAETIVPKLRDQRRIRCWSAGCSTGEEPYSIAMTLTDAIPDIKSWDIEILATDIDSNVLQKARRGIYEMSRVEGLDSRLLKRHFKRGSGNNEGYVKANPALSEMIRFEQLNLLRPWPIREKLDFILCRNVVIYFDKPTKNKLVDRYADQLVDEGWLFMGHSESLFKSTERFKLLGKTIYQKVEE